MALKITIPDRRNTGVEMTFFNIDRIEIHNSEREKTLHIQLGGYLNEAQYQGGSNPIETRVVIVPFEEPEDGDDFTSLRNAINTKIAAFIADAQKLVLKTEAWKDADVN